MDRVSSASKSTVPAFARVPGVTAGGPAFALPLAIAVTVLAWASAFVVIRAVGETFSPGPLALVRLLVGGAALGLFQLGRPWIRPTGREWAFLAAFGVLWFGGYNLLLNFAELTLDAGTASMLVNVGPILLAIGAVLVLGERLTPLQWFAIALMIAASAGCSLTSRPIVSRPADEG